MNEKFRALKREPEIQVVGLCEVIEQKKKARKTKQRLKKTKKW